LRTENKRGKLMHILGRGREHEAERCGVLRGFQGRGCKQSQERNQEAEMEGQQGRPAGCPAGGEGGVWMALAWKYESKMLAFLGFLLTRLW
jgi:hypothetical protein